MGFLKGCTGCLKDSGGPDQQSKIEREGSLIQGAQIKDQRPKIEKVRSWNQMVQVRDERLKQA
jgi:hypothetical protein